MTVFQDAFAHDLFPDMRTMKAFSFVDRPVLAKLEANSRPAVGDTWSYPCLQQAATAQGTTRTEVQAQAAVADADFSGEEFRLGYFKPGYKGGFIIDDFDMALTEGSGGVPDGAYLEKFGEQMRQHVLEFGQRQERYFLGKPGRSLAVTTANATDASTGTNLGGGEAGTIQLADPLAIGAFRLGQRLQVSANDGSGAHSLLASGAIVQITGLNLDNGTMTTTSTGDFDSHSAAAFLFNASDFQGTGGTPNVLPPGFQDWITASTPSGVFQGVDRSNDSRLGGWRLPTDSISGMGLEQIIELALQRAYQLFGATGKYEVLMSPSRWTQLVNEAKKRGERPLNGTTAIMGYKYIEIVHGMMRAECIPTPSMSNDDLFFAKFENDGWCVRHLNGWPRVFNGDGLKLLRSPTADTLEFRTASYYHFGCKYVNLNGRVDISGVSL